MRRPRGPAVCRAGRGGIRPRDRQRERLRKPQPPEGSPATRLTWAPTVSPFPRGALLSALPQFCRGSPAPCPSRPTGSPLHDGASLGRSLMALWGFRPGCHAGLTCCGGGSVPTCRWPAGCTAGPSPPQGFSPEPGAPLSRALPPGPVQSAGWGCSPGLWPALTCPLLTQGTSHSGCRDAEVLPRHMALPPNSPKCRPHWVVHARGPSCPEGPGHQWGPGHQLPPPAHPLQGP